MDHGLRVDLFHKLHLLGGHLTVLAFQSGSPSTRCLTLALQSPLLGRCRVLMLMNLNGLQIALMTRLVLSMAEAFLDCRRFDTAIEPIRFRLVGSDRSKFRENRRLI